MSHNKNINTYGCTPEELMFGTRITTTTDMLDTNRKFENQEEYASFIFQHAEKMREKAREKMDKKALQNRTYKNKNRLLKEFKEGDLVLHKQLQASTGIGSKYKPLLTGPYSIIKINDDKCTAMLENLSNKNVIKAHFTNMQLLNFPNFIKLKDDFDKDFIQETNDKYTLDKYKLSQSNHPNQI